MKNIIIYFSFSLCLCTSADKEIAPLILFDPGGTENYVVQSRTNDTIHLRDRYVQVHFNSEVNTSTITIGPSKGLWNASDYRFVRCGIENLNNEPELVELGFGDYDLTLGATIVPAHGKRTLKAIVYRTDHPAYIDSVFPTMHGKPDGVLRGWMASTYDSIAYIRLIFPEGRAGDSVRIGRIWLEERYDLLSENELKEKFYPFVDEFGQYLFKEWPGKITSVEDLKAYDSLERQDLSSSGRPPEWNKYGGWEQGPQLEATGRFRVEKYDGKWWFVDPDGKLFWSHGIDCVEFGTQTRTRVSDREYYFQYLPAPESPEAQLYTSSGEPVNETRWLSFHAMNLFRKYGESWKQLSGDRLHERLQYWGMNTIGNWSDPDIYLKRKTPYVLTAYSPKKGLIADPYAIGFQEDIEGSLMSKQEELNDPWCLGVFVDNELKWGVKWAPKIPDQIQTAPEDQPSKIAFRDIMKSKYESIGDLNDAWGTSFGNWNGLMRNTMVIPAAADDMRDFMKEFTSHYYSQCRDAVKNTDPDMLYMGCRMAVIIPS